MLYSWLKKALPQRKPRRPFKPQIREGSGVCSTPSHQDHSEQMINIFVILAWHILYSQSRCLQVQCPEKETDVHKFMPQTLDGLELSQWHPEVKHIRPWHCCLLGMESHQHVFATMPKRWYKVSFITSSKMLHVTWNSWSHILPDQMLQNEKWKSLRRGWVKNCCSPDTQKIYGMSA